MEISRQKTFDMFEINYCPKCGKIVEMKMIPTGMPGIQCKQCKQCDGYYTCNFLEDEDDMLQCPNDFIVI